MVPAGSLLTTIGEFRSSFFRAFIRKKKERKGEERVGKGGETGEEGGESERKEGCRLQHLLVQAYLLFKTLSPLRGESMLGTFSFPQFLLQWPVMANGFHLLSQL